MLITLAQQPVAKSLRIEWVTARELSNTSGASMNATVATKTAEMRPIIHISGYVVGSYQASG